MPLLRTTSSSNLPSVAEGVHPKGEPQLVNLIVTDGRVSGVDQVVPLADSGQVLTTLRVG